MKNICAVLLLTALSFSAFSQTPGIKNLVGRWESPDGAGLEILDSSRIFLVYGTERKPILSYKADFSKTPHWFDFVVKDTAQNLSTLKSLLLLEKDVLKWQVFEGDERPANFTASEGDVVILRRKRN